MIGLEVIRVDAAGLIIMPEAPATQRQPYALNALHRPIPGLPSPLARVPGSCEVLLPPARQVELTGRIPIHCLGESVTPRRVVKATFSAVNDMQKLPFVQNDAATMIIPHPHGHPHVLRARGLACAQ